MKPHAFVAMPVGTRPNNEGTPVDFDRVYAELIKPALEDAGCEVFRADVRAGDIRTDMFSTLPEADLLVADVTLNDPNLLYEFGVRHALRARSVVLVQGVWQSQPFDIYTHGKLSYRLKDGALAPATLDADRKALAAMASATLGNRDWFFESRWQPLRTLSDLECRPIDAALTLAIVDAEIRRSTPRQVILFSGHVMDAPDRATPRFPAYKEAAAAQEIAQTLDALGACAGDLALCLAAAGGDLLFLEACQQRGVRCQILLPSEEPEFIDRSVLPASLGERWRDRYFALKEQLEDAPRIMPDELGPLPKGVNPYERCNLWLLYTALGWGVDKVRFVCLWDGGGGDGPGGTKHMYDEVKRRKGRITWIDTRTL
jgi:hypothetical protein